MIQQQKPTTPGLQEVFPTLEEQIEAIPGYADASRNLAGSIHQAVLEGGETTRNIADVLHGTWLGHPLHPVLTDIPIGAWSLAALFEGLEVITGSQQAGRMADTLMTIGTVAAVPTALAGMADYSASKQDATPLIAAHGALNSVSLILYVMSLNARRRRERGRGRLFSAIAFGLTTISAGIGGDLVYRKRVGVNHTPMPSGPTEWTDVSDLNSLEVGAAQRIDVEGSPVLLYRPDSYTINAISAVCNHAGGPLDEGTISNGCVECPWHQSVFDLSDGRAVHGPATMPQPFYATRVRNGQIQIKLGDESERITPPNNPLERAIGE